MFSAALKYFLGESTPDGFKTNFESQIKGDGFYTYILKGGPGTGKSNLIKKIALEFSDKDELELYYCSGDPLSLDALVLKNAKTVIVDGTSPHVFDAMYPGAFQSIVNLGECWDSETLLKHKDEIKRLTDENAAWHSRCKRYITAFASINSDIYSIGHSALNIMKLSAFTSRMAKKLLPKKEGKDGEISYKKLSAITMDGYTTMPVDFYENIIIINDPYFAAGDCFLQGIADIAASKGYNAIVSQCCHFNSNIFEHVLIPELKLAFLSSNPVNCISTNQTKCINALRFYDKEYIHSKKHRIEFSRKAAEELKKEAVLSLKNAKKIHDKMEEFYINAVDFEKVNMVAQKIISEIYSKYKF
ncbi:MAG: ATPase [Oscillospiraceae bacterium]|nr:ATPase [Oscillospiraceae bacterium]